MDKELGYDLNIAKSLTGIEDEELLKFYINSVILKIERVIGYKLLKSKITSLVGGLNTNYVFLPEKEIEEVLNVNMGCKILPFSYINRKVIFDEIISKNSYVEIQYIAGYNEIPSDILLFICSTIKETITNEEGLKSYGIRGINYTFLNKIEQSDNFIRSIRDLFGIVGI
ncbi:MAG: hypothetical protein HXM14_00565 [Fusobacterium periodonticum]|nr:hypothetical protein [Fusobacterium periodonticum]